MSQTSTTFLTQEAYDRLREELTQLSTEGRTESVPKTLVTGEVLRS